MKLHQGIDLTTSHNAENNNLSVNISTFPLGVHNFKPYRNNKLVDQTFVIENIDMNDPESVRVAQANISEKLADITKGNTQSFKAFSSEQSFEHFAFLKSGFNNKNIIFHGMHVKSQNTQRIKPQKNSSFEREKVPNISNNCLYIDFFTHHERNSKAYEVKLAGYNNNFDIRSEQNPIFNSQFVLHESNTSFDEDFMEILHKHVTSPTNQGKDIAIRADSRSSHIISALNKRLKEEGYNTAHHLVATKPNQQTINRSEQFIRDAVIRKHKKLDDLSDKNVVFCDGSYMKDIPEPLISGAFILRSSDLPKTQKNVEVQKPNDDTRNSNSSEILALKNALNYVAANGLTEKPLHIVFDSNYVAKRLKSMKNGSFDELEKNKLTPYFEEIKDILEKSDIQLEVHIVKSHQENVYGSSKTNVVKYNEEVDEMTRSGIRKFMKLGETNRRSFDF